MTTHYRLMRLAVVLLLAASAVSTPALAGRRTSPASLPGYAVKIQNHISWPSFPVRVYFQRDSHYTSARQRAALQGMDRWVKATDGRVSYQVVSSRRQAQITIGFYPGSNNGYTTTDFDDGRRITSADVKVGVKRGWSSDIACIAAHEFGHALGIDGHSPHKGDLMYASHWMGSAWRITGRDLDTLAYVYPALTARTSL